MVSFNRTGISNPKQHSADPFLVCVSGSSRSKAVSLSLSLSPSLSFSRRFTDYPSLCHPLTCDLVATHAQTMPSPPSANRFPRTTASTASFAGPKTTRKISSPIPEASVQSAPRPSTNLTSFLTHAPSRCSLTLTLHDFAPPRTGHLRLSRPNHHASHRLKKTSRELFPSCCTVCPFLPFFLLLSIGSALPPRDFLRLLYLLSIEPPPSVLSPPCRSTLCTVPPAAQ